MLVSKFYAPVKTIFLAEIAQNPSKLYDQAPTDSNRSGAAFVFSSALGWNLLPEGQCAKNST
jgi:hypothetical protein